MTQTHGIMPRMEHYDCMVDLLGHSSQLYITEVFITKMGIDYDALVWENLLLPSQSMATWSYENAW